MSGSGQNSQYCGQVSNLDDKSHQLCSPYYSLSFPWVERWGYESRFSSFCPGSHSQRYKEVRAMILTTKFIKHY